MDLGFILFVGKRNCEKKVKNCGFIFIKRFIFLHGLGLDSHIHKRDNRNKSVTDDCVLGKKCTSKIT